MSDTTYETGYLAAKFGLTIDGVELARFTSVDGMTINVDTFQAPETTTDGKLVVHAAPGSVTYGPLILSRQLTDDNALLEWHKTVGEEGEPTRKTGEIVFYDRADERRGAIAFEGAFIEAWSCSPLHASSNGYVYETIHMSIDRLYRPE